MRMLLTWVILVFFLLQTVSSEADLQNQNHDQINPVNDYQRDETNKEQDKRTIFSNHHGWAKHVAVHPAGFKYILGYGPVELKYVPVAKPISIRPYHHHHKYKYHLRYPTVHVKPLLPVKPVIHHDGWKPLVPIVKPVAVPIHKPWPEEGWSKPVHVHHPVKPVHTVVDIRPVQPIVPVQPLVPLKPVHVHVPIKPVIPSKPLIPVVQPVPIAPVGTTVVQQIPIASEVHYPHHHHHHHVTSPVVFPHLHNAHVHPHLHHAHVENHLYPHLHHAHFEPHLHPHLHHAHVEPHLQPHFHHAHLQGVTHEHHDVQTPVLPHAHAIPEHLHPLPHQHPHLHAHPEIGFPHVYQIPLPQAEVHHHDPHAVVHQHPVQSHLHLVPQTGPTLYHETVAGGVHHHFKQQIQHGDGATSNILLQGSIQPGHTDLQIPEHLPIHPNYLPEEGRHFQPGNFHDPSQHPDVVRPNISLEPPFNHKK